MLRCLEVLDQVGVVHSDIKPDNWVLKWNSVDLSIGVCLIDFGKAKPTAIKTKDMDLKLSYQGPYAARGLCSLNPLDAWTYEV